MGAPAQERVRVKPSDWGVLKVGTGKRGGTSVEAIPATVSSRKAQKDHRGSAREALSLSEPGVGRSQCPSFVYSRKQDLSPARVIEGLRAAARVAGCFCSL